MKRDIYIWVALFVVILAAAWIDCSHDRRLDQVERDTQRNRAFAKALCAEMGTEIGELFLEHVEGWADLVREQQKLILLNSRRLDALSTQPAEPTP